MKQTYLVITIIILTGIFIISYLPLDTDWNQQQIMKINKSKEFCFFVVSDMHNNFPAFNSFLESINKNYSFGFVVGDSAHTGTNEEFKITTHLLKKIPIPIIFVIGNHEVWTGSEFAYKQIFGKTYFSFNISDSQFIILDNSFGSIDVEQFEWLKQELNKKYTNKFIIMHIPIINPFKNIYNTPDAIILENLFKEKNVTFVISADLHNYAEFSKDGINYLLTGSGGGTTNNSFNYIDVCITKNNIAWEKIDFGKQSDIEQKFYVAIWPALVIIYKAVLIVIVAHLVMDYLRKNLR